MTTIKTMLAAAAISVLPAAALANVTIENRTDKTHTVTFDKGSEDVKHKVEAGASVSERCPDGCGVRFSGHDRVSQDGEKLAIIEGQTRPVLITD